MGNQDRSIFIRDDWPTIKVWHLIGDNIQSLGLLLPQFVIDTCQFT